MPGREAAAVAGAAEIVRVDPEVTVLAKINFKPSHALVLAQLAQREKAAGRITAIVTADASDAQRLLDEMAFFAPALRCALFPDWETLPYDRFSPHQDLISDRLLALYRLAEASPGVLVVPTATLMQRIAPVAFVTASALALEKAEPIAASLWTGLIPRPPPPAAGARRRRGARLRRRRR